MRIFVTGASGFVGCHVTHQLLARGHSVSILAAPGDPLRRLQDVRGEVDVVTALLSEIDVVRNSLLDFRPEACIHLAWYAEPGQYLHSMENSACLADSLVLLSELIRSGCRQVVMAGTCAEYDTNHGYLREDTPVEPKTLYAAAKVSCYLMGREIAAQSRTSFAWGRIFYPYGPHEDERRVVPAAICSLLEGCSFPTTKGEQIRDYIHVEDVAMAFCLLAEQGADGVFNIASGTPVTMRQLLETIGALMGRSDLLRFGALPYRPWDPPFICGDNQRLRQIGWEPNQALSQGLAHTIEWWRSRDEKDGVVQ
jgi:nucleoside-diphosphate-sugar epimerase